MCKRIIRRHGVRMILLFMVLVGFVKKALPSAQIAYFNGTGDLIAALEAGKIDGFPGDEPALQLMKRGNDNLTILDGYMDSFVYGAIFPKSDNGDKL